jgi:hypothetical protein
MIKFSHSGSDFNKKDYRVKIETRGGEIIDDFSVSLEINGKVQKCALDKQNARKREAIQVTTHPKYISYPKRRKTNAHLS